MSHRPDESGLVPDDRLLIRPHVAHSGRPSPPTTPAWPRTGPPVSYRAPQPAPAAPDPAPNPVSAARGRAGRLPLVVLTLLVVGTAGGLVFLRGGPDPEPARAVTPPGLSVPVLPRGSGADQPSTKASAPSSGASAAPSASVSARPLPAPSASRGARSEPPTGAPVVKPAARVFVTLRPGDRGPAVRTLQERLYAQGFTYVSVSGIYDGQTRRGVAQLQRDRDIEGDPQGVYGPATQAAFGSGG